jgi:hypothetical protein
MCGNSAHISRRLGSIRTLTLESQIAMTGDIALSAGGRLDNPLYILFCQLTSLLVG